MTQVTLQDVSFYFDGSPEPVIRRANVKFEAGEFALLCGPTGSGKSTFLKLINRLAPNFTGGRFHGRVSIGKQDISNFAPHDVAELIGFVNQKPEDAFVTETVREELAYGMEQLGFDPAVMLSRIQQIADLVGLTDFLDSKLTELSGGEQQRAAIGAALTAGQRVLLLDEPTSSLDAKMTDELVTLLRKLVDELSITVVLAEHRIERVLDEIDSVVMVHADGSVTKGPANSQFSEYRITPPIIDLGKRLCWDPLETKVQAAQVRWLANHASMKITPIEKPGKESANIVAEVTDLAVSYSNNEVLKNLNFKLSSGKVSVLMGANGSGKSSALWAIQGTGIRSGGKVATLLGDPRDLSFSERIKVVAMVPQQASDLLFLNTLSQELSESDDFSGNETGTTGKLFEKLAGRIDPRIHPRDLSSGQQLALVLASQLSKGAPLLLLDEPTRGLDYQAKNQLANLIIDLKAEGKAILVASHDVEFVAIIADEIMLLNEGRISKTGTRAEILLPNCEYATQIGKITQRQGLLRMSQLNFTSEPSDAE